MKSAPVWCHVLVLAVCAWLCCAYSDYNQQLAEDEASEKRFLDSMEAGGKAREAAQKAEEWRCIEQSIRAMPTQKTKPVADRPKETVPIWEPVPSKLYQELRQQQNAFVGPPKSGVKHFKETQAYTETTHGRIVLDSVEEVYEGKIDYTTTDGTRWRVAYTKLPDGSFKYSELGPVEIKPRPTNIVPQ